MDEQQYRMALTDVQWWCCDIPGNIGWIIWIVCNVKALIEGVDLYSILMLLPTALMLIGVVELISERIAKLAAEKGITEAVFDRGGYISPGRVQALAEGAREGGLDF